MAKTLIIHIGHYKTGTTALQIFFNKHTKFLAKAGIVYPDVWMHHAKHSAFAFSILRAAGVEKIMYDYTDPTPPQEMWGNLYEWMDHTSHQTVLISSEEFMRMGQFPKAQGILHQVLEQRPDDVEVKAVAYLREPGPHLKSWYNQLIKMNFPVANLASAVNGDIEEIHFDYQRALSPWIDILGEQNVMIRPYVKDPSNPAALHQDFMSALGVTLPADLLNIQNDPNPRLDDRMIELMRLMQNMELPRSTINTIRTRAQTYLEKQDLLTEQQGTDAGTGTGTGMTHARTSARAGLDWLARQSGNQVDTEIFAHNLPDPASRKEAEQTLMLGFVLSEVILLRQRIKKLNISDITQRLDDIERQIGKAGGAS
jgi:hypothetical protein